MVLVKRNACTSNKNLVTVIQLECIYLPSHRYWIRYKAFIFYSVKPQVLLYGLNYKLPSCFDSSLYVVTQVSGVNLNPTSFNETHLPKSRQQPQLLKLN